MDAAETKSASELSVDWESTVFPGLDEWSSASGFVCLFWFFKEVHGVQTKALSCGLESLGLSEGCWALRSC